MKCRSIWTSWRSGGCTTEHEPSTGKGGYDEKRYVWTNYTIPREKTEGQTADAQRASYDAYTNDRNSWQSGHDHSTGLDHHLLADNGSQKADVRAGDNNQINISQTKDGDIINHFEKTGSVSRSADPLEDLPEEPCPQWLARAYDLVREGRQTGEFDEAKLVIGKMLEAKGMDLQSRCILQYNLGLAYYFSGEIGSAQWAFQEAVKGGGFPYAYYCLGLTYVAEESEKTTKDYTKAIDAFTRAIEGEENSEYYRARAQAYKKSGDLEAAAQDMKMMDRLLAAEQQS